MHNPYLDYFRTQAGTGIAGFQGVKHQRGHGFLGRWISKAWNSPLLRFFGETAGGPAVDFVKDVIVDKKNIKEAAKRRFNEAAENILSAGVKRAKKFAQDGEGRRRKRLKIKPKENKKPKKSIKRRKRSKKPKLSLFE